jgi:putative tricarboxylic transport membrane protein
VGLGFAGGGYRYGFGSWREPGAGLLPLVFGTILAVLSAVLFLVRLTGGAGEERRRFWIQGGSWGGVVLAFLALVAYTAILKKAGFVVTTFLFIFFLVKCVGGKRWHVSILTALAFSLVCYGLFSILGTPLPKGPF